MSSPSPADEDRRLVDERNGLCQALRAQRQVLAQRLGPQRSAIDRAFPRSKTMRFLIDRPAMAARLFAGAATFLVGARLVKRMTTAVVVARVVRSVVKSEPGS